MGQRPRKYGKTIQLTNTLLVDGNALFKLGFYGAKDVFNRKGEHVGGLYQFITIIRMLLKENLYHRVFVFWDGKFSGIQRYHLYSDYKVDRGKDWVYGSQPVDIDEVKEKFLITQYLEELFIRQHIDNSKTGIEADDYIAYYCNTKADNEKITICTSDRDLCQLIQHNVELYLCDLKEYVNLGNYNYFFKHHQSNSKLIKIIGGDQSDSIKGVKGVKETTLLKYFPELKEKEVSLNRILGSAKRQQAKRIKENKKPLKALTNIIESVTDGVQGDKLYEINKKLVDLSNPLMDYKNKRVVEDLRLPIGDVNNRGIKNVYGFMKRDGFSELMDNFSTEYLLPFKELIEREKKNN